MLDPAFGHLIVVGSALLFANAAAHKLRDLARFTEVLAAYQVLPDAPARRLAWLIPCIELCAAAALLWMPSRRAAIVCAIAVLIAYAWGMVVNLNRGRFDLDCGCGSARDRRVIGAWMVWRNLFLAAALGIAALPWSARPLGFIDFPTIFGGLLVAITLYAAVDRLLGDIASKTRLLRSAS
jgi:hypothetical protein